VVSIARTDYKAIAMRLDTARHLLSQRVGLQALGETAFRGLLSQVRRPKMPSVPGPELRAMRPSPSRELVDAYVRSVGGDPAAYQDSLPPHLFPQWAFLLMSRTLAGLPYPMLKVVNAGCRLEMRRPLPQHETLEVTAQLERIDADERKAMLTQKIVTGTQSTPEAIIAHLSVFVPLGGKRKSGDQPRQRIPADARELESWDLPITAGLEYATLTGDFNPIHWVRPYARAMGFKNPILHGFASMARAYEGVQRHLFGGSIHSLGTFDVRFTKPLVLPGRVSLYVRGSDVYLGSAFGQPAFLEGTFTAREGAAS
jgi:acyl dehydratase